MHAKGYFLLACNTQTKRLVNTVCIVGEEASIGETISLTTPWRMIRKTIENVQLAGRADAVRGASLRDALHALVRDDCDTIATLLKEQNTKELIDEYVSYAFLKVFKSSNVGIELAFEVENAVDYAVQESPPEVRDTSAPAATKAVSRGTAITVIPVVSPMAGTLITDLAKGDIIFVRIADESLEDIAYRARMEQKHDERNPKVPVRITSVTHDYDDKHDKTRVTLTVELEEGFYGTFFEEESIKVMRVSSRYGREQSTLEHEMRQDRTFNLVVQIGLVVLFIALAIFIISKLAL